MHTNKNLAQLKTEHHHLSIVSHFAIEMLSLNTIDEVIWFLARQVVASLGFNDVVIYLYDSETKTLIQKAAFGNKNPQSNDIHAPINIKLGQGIVGQAARDQKALLIEDTRKHDNYIVDDQQRLSELAVPIIVDNQLIGVIDSEHPEVGFYTEQHLKTLQSIALIAGTKIVKNQSIIKLEQTIAQLEESRTIQDTLFEIAELIFETDSIEKFYQKLHICISKLTYAKNFMVALLTDDGKGLIFPYCVDEVDTFPADEIVPYNPEKISITGYVIKIGKPVLANAQELNLLEEKKNILVYGTKPKAWLGVPFNNKKLRGAVIVQSYSDDYLYDEKDKQILAFAAKHIRNAIERIQAREDLKFLALHDPLTQLPNRLLFSDRIEHALQNIKRKADDGLAIMFLDLDNFKTINDTHGHLIGDVLLKKVAFRIAKCLRENDTLSRLGGDEFAILLEAIDVDNQVKIIAERIIEAVQQPFHYENITIKTSTSLGISIYSTKCNTADKLIKQADEAMYFAKANGRNQIAFFNSINKKTNPK